MLRKFLIRIVIIAPLFASVSVELVAAQTTAGTTPTYSSGTGVLSPVTSGGISAPAGYVYGNTTGGVTGGQILGAYGLGNQILNGNLTGAAAQLPNVLSSFGVNLSPQLSGILSTAPGAISNLLNGNYSGVISQLPNILQSAGVQISSQLSNILGAAGPVIGSLLSGNFSLGTLVNAVASFFGFGSGSSSISWSNVMQGVLTNPATSSITGSVFGTVNNPLSQALGQQTPNANTILAQTGTILCAWNTACLTSNPVLYRDLYTSASGAMGYPNPNAVAGNISRLSRQGVHADPFSNDVTQNSVYMRQYSDREIPRARAEEVVGEAGQKATADSIKAAEQTAQVVTKRAEQCVKDSKATQDLVRCHLETTSAVQATYLTSLHSLALKGREDNQFGLIMQANESATADADRRKEDVEKSALSYSVGEIFFADPKSR
jgi:hypothetical protein